MGVTIWYQLIIEVLLVKAPRLIHKGRRSCKCAIMHAVNSSIHPTPVYLMHACMHVYMRIGNHMHAVNFSIRPSPVYLIHVYNVRQKQKAPCALCCTPVLLLVT